MTFGQKLTYIKDLSHIVIEESHITDQSLGLPILNEESIPSDVVPLFGNNN